MIVIISVVIHEIGHYSATKALKIKINKFELELNGVRIDTNYRCLTLCKEMVFLLAGSFLNILTSIIFQGEIRQVNLFIGLVNLLPVIPLDGGRLLYEFVVRRYGIHTARQLLKILGKIVGVATFILGLLLLYLSKYNFTLAMLGVMIFVYSNINVGLDYIAEAELRQAITFENPRKSRIYTANSKTTAIQIIKSVPNGSVIAVVDDRGVFLGFATYTQILNELLNTGYHAILEDILKN